MNDNARVRPSRCETCEYWDQRFPENKHLGVCKRMGITQWGTRAHVSVTTNSDGAAMKDFEIATTLHGFGCVLHSDYVFMQLSGTV